MSKPAARAGDLHICPAVTGDVPHVGGPLIASQSSVLIGGLPAATLNDQAVCTGPCDHIAGGSASVRIAGRPAVRQGDASAHGGVVTGGCPTVLIG